MIRHAFFPLALLLLLPAGFCRSAVGADSTSFDYDFGTGPAKPGTVHVAASAAYTPESGYGFENHPTLAASAHGVTGATDSQPRENANR